ncbi:xanthine dehydrogenase small subunit [Alkalinema sp. FACHB-956]|uniref:xanthine dehydrogenase small subunit n=1 Tax=Alkalinema sp. FACHB-956 TaxID=2692768 RepID=UPI001F54CB78|nr:xanthine dehydrogenase small subunit [Alkalinema sp. FACHB-956]
MPMTDAVQSHNLESQILEFTLNGQTVRLSAVSPTMTLLQYLQQSGRSGTKEGCGDGDCGACTVAVMGQDAQGKPTYHAINSCLIPIGAIAGRTVITVESLAEAERLHPVQAAMVETGGSQCGYCTPGFIMSLFAAYYGADGAIPDETVEGNLCRCTGYLPIRRAAQQLSQQLTQPDPATPRDRFSAQLANYAAPRNDFAYISPTERFYRPTQLQTALELLHQYPDAVVLAGGTDLGLDLSHRRRSFPTIIALEAIPELQEIQQLENSFSIGASVSLSHLKTKLHGYFPSLDEMLVWFAAQQVRNRATMGGNLATASPIGDLPPVLLALDAIVELVSLDGVRRVPIAEFFTGYRKTVLQPGELIRSIEIPTTLTPETTQRHSQSYKIGKRGTDDISIVAAAFTIDLDAHNTIVHARLAYGGVAATPIRAIAIEQDLIGQPWTRETVRACKPRLHDCFTPLSDLRGSAHYRKTLVANLFEKFFIDMGGR